MRFNDKTLHRIKKSLGKDGVWVAPGLRKTFPKRVERKIVRAVDGAKPKVYAVLVKVPPGHPKYNGKLDNLIRDVRGDVGPGVYVGIDNNANLTVGSYRKGGEQDAFFAREAAKHKHPNDIAAQVVSATRLASNGKARSTYERLEKPDPIDSGPRKEGVGVIAPSEPTPSAAASTSRADSDEGGPGVAVGVGVVLALVVAGVVAAVFVRRRKGGPLAHAASPAPLLTLADSIRWRRHRRRARRDVAALGRRIAEAAPGLDNEALREAVDHHTIARRIIDGPHSQADAVGVIVLVMRGNDALDASVDEMSWKPTAPCYLNPMHGWSVRHVSWRGAAGGLELPACRECADTIETGRMPDDVLDFLHGGRPRHYFALVLEPWSSTGFGSLETDLLPLLQPRPR
ncbi:MAG TPA: hypothetical protein VK059_13750 [Nocardioidaceae bacterium]|nr:hypothetical protein [Nocardioidaceae bacterium]